MPKPNKLKPKVSWNMADTQGKDYFLVGNVIEKYPAVRLRGARDCRGLSNCKHDVIGVPLSETIKKGKKKLCGWED